MSRDKLSTNSIRVGVTAQEIVDIALNNVGIAWTTDGCTDFVWGVTNLAGAPFFDLNDRTVDGDPTLPADAPYVVPHSPGIASGTNDVGGDGWTTVFAGESAASLTAELRPGDVVRVYKAGNAAEDSVLPDGGYGAHSFVVVSVTGAGVEVVDNWNAAGIILHNLEDIITEFAPDGEFEAAFVSRLDETYAAQNFDADVSGNGFGDFSGFADAGGGGSDGQGLSAEAQIILAGAFLARTVYGGSAIPEQYRNNIVAEHYIDGQADPYKYDDDYAEFLENSGWRGISSGAGPGALDPSFFTSGGDVLGSFSSGGLYKGEGTRLWTSIDSNLAEALVAETTIDGSKAVVIAFRGSDGLDAAFEGQTWSANGAKAYFEALQPLIRAVFEYVTARQNGSLVNGVEKVIVSGHSLGGTMVDIFSLISGTQRDDAGTPIIGAQNFLSAGVDLSVVSLASAGVPRDLGRVLELGPDVNLRSELVAVGSPPNITFVEREVIDSIRSPEFYTGINHLGDRVHFGRDAEPGTAEDDGQSPVETLGFGPANNAVFPSEVSISLPNILNTDVIYSSFLVERNAITGQITFGQKPASNEHGFGAEHNAELYWANVSALVRDPLFGSLNAQNRGGSGNLNRGAEW